MLLRRALIVLLLLLGAAAAPATAQAAPSQLSIMLDDDQLLDRGDDARDDALRRMKSLGVDYARVSILWSVVAENSKKGSARRRFRGEDPSTYPLGNWDRYDRLVRAARTIGVGLYFNVTGPGPRWAHGRAPRSERENQATWRPNSREFGKFVRAVGTRYSGTYRDENDTREPLPRISFWAIYNEPNQGGWLTPQYVKRGRKSIPYSPVMYRDLWLEGRRGLDVTGHQRDVVLIGETAPLGSNGVTAKSPIRPKKFIRELFCVKSNGRRYTGRDARDRRCTTLKRIKKFRTTAWAHHPYTKKLPPNRRDVSRDSISMANVSDLGRLLDQMATRTKRIARATPTIMTEFGYETTPPDPFNGVTLAQQAAYINEGDYIAYKDPRILGQTQFLLRDVDPVKGAPRNSKRYWFTYQSGLLALDGTPKPAALAYRHPFVVTPSGDRDRLWGQLRFLPNGMRSQVELQFRPQGAAEFTTVEGPVPVTNGSGFYEAERPSPGPGTWRAVWRDPGGGGTITSREVPVS